jgi:hypothetical protein
MNPPNDLRDSDCAGFYHWPPLWIGTPPVEQGADLTPNVINAETFSGDLVCGVRLKVSKQALFIFDFADWKPASGALAKDPLHNWEERVFARMRFMNFFLACFYTSILRIQRTTSEKLYIDYTTYLAAKSFALNPSHMQCDSRQSSAIRDAEEYHTKFGHICKTVPENVLRTVIDMTNTATAKNFDDTTTLADLLLHAFFLHESGKYEASHITAWTIAEKCLNDLWKTYLCELNKQHTASGTEGRFINSDRKDKLTGRDFTASIISESLSLSGILPFEQYKLTSSVRKKRNDWLHDLDAIDRADAAEAIGLAQFMLRKTGVFDVEMPFHVIGSIPIAWLSE